MTRRLLRPLCWIFGCEECGTQTRSYDKRWQELCPTHWQELMRMPR